MLVERNRITGMDGQARNGDHDPGSPTSLALLIDGLVREVEALQQALDELVQELEASDPEDQATVISHAVRLEGLSQARALVNRAQQVAQRANAAARNADGRPPVRAAVPAFARAAELASVPTGAAAAHVIPETWATAEPATPSGPHPNESATGETSPAPPVAEPQPSFNSSGGALELSVMPPDGEFQRYRIDGPLTFAAMLALKQAVGKLRGVSSVRVAPRPDGATVLTLISRDPGATLRDLQNVPGFMMRLVSS